MARRSPVIAAVGAFLLCGGIAVADDGHGGTPAGRNGIAGTWLVKVLFAEGTPMELKLQYPQSFNDDGRTTLLLPTGGPPDYPETGDPRVGCMGEWKRRHARHSTFDVMLICLPSQQWEPPAGSPDPTVYQELQVKATLSRDGNTWKGPFVISNYGADGTQVFTGPGTMEATRVRVKPLP